MKKMFLPLLIALAILALVACGTPKSVSTIANSSSTSDGSQLIKKYTSAILAEDYKTAGEIMLEVSKSAASGDLTLAEAYHIGDIIDASAIETMMKDSIALSPAASEIADIICTIEKDTLTIDYYYKYLSRTNFSDENAVALDSIGIISIETFREFFSSISDPESILLISPIDIVCNFYSESDKSLLHTTSENVEL